MTIQFIKYETTPSEKHLGIATIKLNGIVLKYKIVPNKDGKGWFPSAPSYKITDDQGERYVAAFLIDSNSEDEEAKEIIRANVKKHMQNLNSIQSPSVFSANSSVQSNNYSNNQGNLPQQTSTEGELPF